MLFLAVIVAFAFYGVLYFASGALSPHLGGATSWLQTLRALVFRVPDAGALLMLKQMIVITALYIAFDLVASFIRLARRPNAKKTKASRRARANDQASGASEISGVISDEVDARWHDDGATIMRQ